MQTWKKTCNTNSNKIQWEGYCLKTSMCVEVMIVLCGDYVYCVYSLLDASVAEEDIEGEYYQEEEEYPGHIANQGKPSFESYSKMPSFTIAYYLF
jgi:hypothetical protein